MDQSTSELRRSLLGGYKRASVRSLLEEQQKALEAASEEAKVAQERADGLETEVQSVRNELASARTDLDTALRHLETSEQELESARGEAEAARSELDAARTELQTVKRELEEARALVDRADEGRREAESRATQLEVEIGVAQAEIASQAERVREADAAVVDLRVRLEEATMAPPPSTNELTNVLLHTQEAVDRIMEEARRSAEDQLSHLQQSREEVRGELERAKEWRDRVQPLMDGFTRSIAETQARIDEIGVRIEEALRPVSESIQTIGSQLDEFTRLAEFPLLEQGDEGSNGDGQLSGEDLSEQDQAGGGASTATTGPQDWT